MVVELGFFEELENETSWTLNSKFFASKIGGKPSWLSLKFLPGPSELKCKLCGSQCKFLLQVYAPLEYENTFHRTIFLFYCSNSNCNIKNSDKKCIAFRSQLPRKNDFYDFEEPKEANETLETSKTPSAADYNELCNLCGCLGPLHCSACKQISYCSKEHQIIDWKQGHKNACKKQENYNNNFCFPEGKLVTELEPDEDPSPSSLVDDVENIHPTLQDVPTSHLEQFTVQEDKIFSKFKQRISREPEQVLRFGDTEPLWVGSHVPPFIPPCECCGAPRQFLFQVMPQLLNYLKCEDIDWGTLAVYTCSQNCDCPNPLSYHREYVWQQDMDDIQTANVNPAIEN